MSCRCGTREPIAHVGEDDIPTFQEALATSRIGSGRMEAAHAAGSVEIGRVKGIIAEADLADDDLHLEHGEASHAMVARLHHGRIHLGRQLGFAHSLP